MNRKIVYLMRHGSYDRSTGELNESGIEKIKEVALLIGSEIDDYVEIYTSPLTRAVQTGKVLKEVFESLNKNVKIDIADELECDEYRIDEFMERVKNFSASYIIAISHKPDIEDYLKSIGIYESLNTGGYKRLEI